MPSAPYAEGRGPTGVEYEVIGVDGISVTHYTVLNEAIEVTAPCRIRYRFLWGDRPGAWDDEGVSWRAP